MLVLSASLPAYFQFNSKIEAALQGGAEMRGYEGVKCEDQCEVHAVSSASYSLPRIIPQANSTALPNINHTCIIIKVML